MVRKGAVDGLLRLYHNIYIPYVYVIIGYTGTFGAGRRNSVAYVRVWTHVRFGAGGAVVGVRRLPGVTRTTT